MSVNQNIPAPALPQPSAVLELLKPITWFAPMWAFGCGVVSSGAVTPDKLWLILGGILLAGPCVCAMSQAANDWYDRHVDAINEPDRPIPSGRIPGTWGWRIAVAWTAVSLALAWVLGPWAFGAAAVACVLAWIYSAPPLRLKRNGWWSAGVCGLSYEGLPWFTGAALMAGTLPDWPVLAAAGLYSLGALGIMTLNDFKAIEGDRALGLRTLPVQLGPRRAAEVACLVMALPQVVVVALHLHWGLWWAAGAVALLLAAQVRLMGRLLADPKGKAPWFNATGTGLYVLGMLGTAIALGTMAPEAG